MQDMYINHIMNDTGATVVLRGRGSGNLENSSIDGTSISFIDVSILVTSSSFVVCSSTCRSTTAPPFIFVKY